MKKTDITNAWFITEAPLILKYLQIYIRGDAIVVIPFTLIILVIAIFSWKWALLLYGIFLVFRFIGEMFYWMLQQFGEKKYRPHDYGFKHLGNNEIYVIYQLLALVWIVFSAGLVIWVLLHW